MIGVDDKFIVEKKIPPQIYLFTLASRTNFDYSCPIYNKSSLRDIIHKSESCALARVPSSLKKCNYFEVTLVRDPSKYCIGTARREKSIAVPRGQLCSTFEFPAQAMTLGATARSRLWSRAGSKLMDWSAIHFL